jgi:predicted nucleic acid-binding protein
MSRFVVDASVAAKLFSNEAHTPEALFLGRSGHELYAPDFFLLELDNIFCKRIRRGEAKAADAIQARGYLRKAPIAYYPFPALQERAFDLAILTRRSVYDCLYLALALTLEARLVTADRRFHDEIAAGPHKRHLVWVGDIPRIIK